MDEKVYHGDDELMEELVEDEEGAEQVSYAASRNEIDRLAAYILKEWPDEPGKDGESESAVDVAIRLLRLFKGWRATMAGPEEGPLCISRLSRRERDNLLHGSWDPRDVGVTEDGGA